MTYNATPPILNALKRGEIISYEAPLANTSETRWLFITPEIDRALKGLNPNFSGFPMRETEKELALFAAGYLVTGSLIGSSNAKPSFEKLLNLDEVWAICVRKPRSLQTRIFGRFIEQRVFVALQIHQRGSLGTTDNYHSVASQVAWHWQAIFGDLNPMRATSLEGYLGGVTRDVDTE